MSRAVIPPINAARSLVHFNGKSCATALGLSDDDGEDHSFPSTGHPQRPWINTNAADDEGTVACVELRSLYHSPSSAAGVQLQLQVTPQCQDASTGSVECFPTSCLISMSSVGRIEQYKDRKLEDIKIESVVVKEWIIDKKSRQTAAAAEGRCEPSFQYTTSIPLRTILNVALLMQEGGNEGTTAGSQGSASSPNNFGDMPRLFLTLRFVGCNDRSNTHQIRKLSLSYLPPSSFDDVQSERSSSSSQQRRSESGAGGLSVSVSQDRHQVECDEDVVEIAVDCTAPSPKHPTLRHNKLQQQAPRSNTASNVSMVDSEDTESVMYRRSVSPREPSYSRVMQAQEEQEGFAHEGRAASTAPTPGRNPSWMAPGAGGVTTNARARSNRLEDFYDKGHEFDQHQYQHTNSENDEDDGTTTVVRMDNTPNASSGRPAWMRPSSTGCDATPVEMQAREGKHDDDFVQIVASPLPSATVANGSAVSSSTGPSWKKSTHPSRPAPVLDLYGEQTDRLQQQEQQQVVTINMNEMDDEDDEEGHFTDPRHPSSAQQQHHHPSLRNNQPCSLSPHHRTEQEHDRWDNEESPTGHFHHTVGAPLGKSDLLHRIARSSHKMYMSNRHNNNNYADRNSHCDLDDATACRAEEGEGQEGSHQSGRGPIQYPVMPPPPPPALPLSAHASYSYRIPEEEEEPFEEDPQFFAAAPEKISPPARARAAHGFTDHSGPDHSVAENRAPSSARFSVRAAERRSSESPSRSIGEEKDTSLFHPTKQEQPQQLWNARQKSSSSVANAAAPIVVPSKNSFFKTSTMGNAAHSSSNTRNSSRSSSPFFLSGLPSREPSPANNDFLEPTVEEEERKEVVGATTNGLSDEISFLFSRQRADFSRASSVEAAPAGSRAATPLEVPTMSKAHALLGEVVSVLGLGTPIMSRDSSPAAPLEQQQQPSSTSMMTAQPSQATSVHLQHPAASTALSGASMKTQDFMRGASTATLELALSPQPRRATSAASSGAAFVSAQKFPSSVSCGAEGLRESTGTSSRFRAPSSFVTARSASSSLHCVSSEKRLSQQQHAPQHDWTVESASMANAQHFDPSASVTVKTPSTQGRRVPLPSSRPPLPHAEGTVAQPTDKDPFAEQPRRQLQETPANKGESGGGVNATSHTAPSSCKNSSNNTTTQTVVWCKKHHSTKTGTGTRLMLLKYESTTDTVHFTMKKTNGEDCKNPSIGTPCIQVSDAGKGRQEPVVALPKQKLEVFVGLEAFADPAIHRSHVSSPKHCLVIRYKGRLVTAVEIASVVEFDQVCALLA